MEGYSAQEWADCRGKAKAQAAGTNGALKYNIFEKEK